MLFLLAIEPLYLLFCHAQNTAALKPLHGNEVRFRMSLYADDVAMFITSMAQYLTMTRHILKIFGEASGLIMNMAKT
jgi:hypothetical protein